MANNSAYQTTGAFYQNNQHPSYQFNTTDNRTQPYQYPNNQQINTQIQQTQQTQQQTIPQRTYIPGRMVTGENDIIAAEVPMDGNHAIFVQQDFKKIYAKTWGNDGYIHTTVFVAEEDQNRNQRQVDPFAMIMARLDGIENQIKSQHQQKPYYRNNRNKQRQDQNKEDKSNA